MTLPTEDYSDRNRKHNRPFWIFVILAVAAGLWWDFSVGLQHNFAEDRGAPRRTTTISRDRPRFRDRIFEPTNVGKNQMGVRQAFATVTRNANQATVQLFAEGQQISMGTVVSPDGWALAKDSQCPNTMDARLADGRRFPATKMASDDQTDLCLLKIDAASLPFILIPSTTPPAVGSLVCTVNGQDLPMAVGVVSSGVRTVPREPGLLGIFISAVDRGVQIDYLIPGSAAEKAGLKLKDCVTQINGTSVRSNNQLQRLVRQHRPGDVISLAVLRDDQSLQLEATLARGSEMMQSEHALQNSMGGELSNRRSGFREVLPHDTILQPEECGGPLVDVEGQIIGINIARAGRVISYALPATLVAERLAALRAKSTIPVSGSKG